MPCANGHPLTENQRFCPSCGAAAVASDFGSASPSAPTTPGAPAAPGYYMPAAPIGQPGNPMQVTYQTTVVQSAGYNGLAIASMVLGILWIYWVGSVLAVIFAGIALNQSKTDGKQGKGMAVAGLVLGLVGLASLAIVLILAATVTTCTYPGYCN